MTSIQRVALVTGGSRGIGRAICVRLARMGMKVGINYVSNPTAAEETLRLIEEAGGGQGFLAPFNVADASAVQEHIKTILDVHGRIDILVNNAGIIRREDALKFSEKDWDDVMNINVKSVFFMSQTVAKQFIAQGNGGKIINIASMLSYQGGIRVPSYTASKSGVMGITRLMANEWAKEGINVNAIAPGYMATNNTAALRADEGRSNEILGRIPANRWGTPEDLMGPIVFLASQASDYINGYTIAVDGGWLAR